MKVEYYIKHDTRTETDNRTTERKSLVKRVKEIKIPYYKTDYGIFAYLSARNIKELLTFNNN